MLPSPLDNPQSSPCLITSGTGYNSHSWLTVFTWLLRHNPLLPSSCLMAAPQVLLLLSNFFFSEYPSTQHHFFCLPSLAPLVILTDPLYMLIVWWLLPSVWWLPHVSSADFSKHQALYLPVFLTAPLGNGLEFVIQMCQVKLLITENLSWPSW